MMRSCGRTIKQKNGKRISTIHIIDTEARTLEEACDIIAAYQADAKKAQTRRGRKPSLKQQFSNANLVAYNRHRWGQISLGGQPIERPPAPQKAGHPLQSLPDEAKLLKAREMFASGLWGTGAVAFRRLARAFAVPIEQIAVWLEGICAPP